MFYDWCVMSVEPPLRAKLQGTCSSECHRFEFCQSPDCKPGGYDNLKIHLQLGITQEVMDDNSSDGKPFDMDVIQKELPYGTIVQPVDVRIPGGLMRLVGTGTRLVLYLYRQSCTCTCTDSLVPVPTIRFRYIALQFIAGTCTERSNT